MKLINITIEVTNWFDSNENNESMKLMYLMEKKGRERKGVSFFEGERERIPEKNC